MGILREKKGKGIQGKANSEPQTWHVSSKSCMSTMKDQGGEPWGRCYEERGSKALTAQCSALTTEIAVNTTVVSQPLEDQGKGVHLLTFHFINIFREYK